MTNSEIYNSAMMYRELRAKSGCGKKKQYWNTELRIRLAIVNHEIIMNRGKAGSSKERPELQEAYDNLAAGLSEAMQCVVSRKS
ncbi:hypothetical protein GAP32_404 [Cronobacter phage vB_CsaM_GAP32]|uniref:Uncharacterized protein n=1 Tax=Cronobacter phage vB_CsaM_GAP32 TaxID=1141136 RepID=K4F7Q2_9CAUD|nr:hypothetical protein GAP32_404 [Cronobacter phage vB_CsaM_GAP32]AFC21857.1 hypothetical protein GAP32_404 [Cronobacter phage vB_CsaM_GAP32]